jgi:hypothetical protein
VVDAATPLLTASWEQPLKAQAAPVAAALEATAAPVTKDEASSSAVKAPVAEEEPADEAVVPISSAEAPEPEQKQQAVTRKIKMSAEAEAAVNGIIARAEAAAAKVAGAVAELSAPDAVGAASGAAVKVRARTLACTMHRHRATLTEAPPAPLAPNQALLPRLSIQGKAAQGKGTRRQQKKNTGKKQ